MMGSLDEDIEVDMRKYENPFYSSYCKANYGFRFKASKEVGVAIKKKMANSLTRKKIDRNRLRSALAKAMVNYKEKNDKSILAS